MDIEDMDMEELDDEDEDEDAKKKKKEEEDEDDEHQYGAERDPMYVSDMIVEEVQVCMGSRPYTTIAPQKDLSDFMALPVQTDRMSH